MPPKFFPFHTTLSRILSFFPHPDFLKLRVLSNTPLEGKGKLHKVIQHCTWEKPPVVPALVLISYREQLLRSM